MANERELKLKLTGDASQAEKAVARLEAALKKAETELAKAKETTEKVDDSVDKLGGKSEHTGGKLSGLGDIVGNVAGDRLGPLGDAADELGVDLQKIDPAVAGAGAALVGMTAFAAGGVTKFTELTDSVRAFHDASGVGWEDSSRLVAVSDDLGIAADAAASSMGRLAKNIDAGKLEEYGIQVVRAKDGTVDMAATLGNVADAMNRTTDPTKRAAMGTALFGKSWAELMPLLEQGSSGIAVAMAGVSDAQIVTEENADAVREWQMALDDVQDAISDLQMTIGKEMLPRLTTLAKDFSWVSDKVSGLTDGMFGLSDVMSVFNPVLGAVDAQTKLMAENAGKAAWSMKNVGDSMGDAAAKGAIAAAANEKLAEAQAAAERKADDLRQRQEDLTQASKDAAKAIDEQRQKLSDLNDLALSINGSDLALERANAGLGESMDTLAEKQKAVTDAVNAYGEDSPEAAAAARDYDKALIDSKGSADNLAKAEVERARKQAEIAGQTLTDAQAVDIYSGSIGRTRDVTNDPNLAAGLDGMAKRTGAVADAAAVAKQKLDEANQAAANLAAQAFGERAADIAKAIINKAPGFNQQRAEPATAGTSVTNNVTVNASTPANPWSIAQDVDWALRTAGR